MISMLPEKLDWLPTLTSSSRERLSDMPSPNSIWQERLFSCFSKVLSSCQLRRESPRSPLLCLPRRRTDSRLGPMPRPLPPPGPAPPPPPQPYAAALKMAEVE